MKSIEEVLVEIIYELTGFEVEPNEAFILLNEYLQIYPEMNQLNITLSK